VATQNPQRFKLGDALRQAREAAGLKPVDVEKELRWYTGKASRVENGTRVPVAAEVDRLAQLYRVSDEQAATLHLLADAARRKSTPAHVADFAQTYVTLERAAEEILYVDAELIPGVLQTEDYARAVLSSAGLTADVEKRVADRVARRRILTQDPPVRLRVALGEAVLHRQVGGPDVHREQLTHLLKVGEMANVDVRIIPFAGGAHPALGVGFTHVRLATSDITRVYIEGLTDATYLHEDDDTAVYAAGFERLWSIALSAAESATILRRRIDP
jgi:hypothetical protein